jgi:aquaporin Z
MFGREKIAAIAAEFIGTFTLVMVVLSLTQRTGFPYFVAVMAGTVLAVMTLAVGSVSGAHLNPAVTIGLWTQRRIDTVKAIVYIATQLLAGLVALTLAEYLLDSPLKNIAGEKFEPRVFVAELVGTIIFTFGIAAVVSQGFKGFKKAFGIGASLSLGILTATLASNGVLNPAVALGIQSWSLAYVVGPILGSIIGMGLYSLLFAPRVAKPKAKATTVAKKPSATKKKPAKKKR